MFVEVKALGKGLQNGFEQLKSYMSNSNTCHYGIVTDGNEMIIINNRYEKLEDIPSFNPAMLPSSIREFKYVDFRNNRDISFTLDMENLEEICVTDGTGEIQYDRDSLIALNIYNNIAADDSIYMNEGEEGRINLPYEWFKGKEECFILKAQSDSMIGAGIDNGDLVIIQRQQTAQNRDIVAV